MKSSFVLSIVLASFPVILVACMPPESESDSDSRSEDVAEIAQGAGGSPPTGLNHFDPIPFWAGDTQTAYRLMGAGPLNAGSGYLPMLTISSSYRDQVLQNAIECGLAQSQSVTDPVTGRVYHGWWGIAPSWIAAALTTTQRRFVTGCMAQRLNATGTTVPILLEGNTPAIYTSSTYEPSYPWDESTVWGDLFSSTTPVGGTRPPFALYACWDLDLLYSCVAPDTPSSWLKYRVCDSTSKCGLIPVGGCWDPSVCVTSGAGYPVCSTPSGVWYPETVHVQLQPGDGTCHP